MTVYRPRIGLALGSGVARGWAHIGVLHALARAGIRPDIVVGTSIGALLLAGIVPGLLTAGVYMVLIVVMAKSGKPGRGGVREFGTQRLPKARPEDWFGMAGGALLFLIVIGGLYAGVFTATEAGALGAFASLVVSASFVVVWGAKRGMSPRSVLIDGKRLQVRNNVQSG